MNTIDICFGDIGKYFINEEIPGLLFSIVQHCCVLVILSLAVSTIANVPSALFSKMVQKEVFIFSMMSS